MKYSLLCMVSVSRATTMSEESTVTELVIQHVQVKGEVWINAIN